MTAPRSAPGEAAPAPAADETPPRARAPSDGEDATGGGTSYRHEGRGRRVAGGSLLSRMPDDDGPDWNRKE